MEIGSVLEGRSTELFVVRTLRLCATAYTPIRWVHLVDTTGGGTREAWRRLLPQIALVRGFLPAVLKSKERGTCSLPQNSTDNDQAAIDNVCNGTSWQRE